MAASVRRDLSHDQPAATSRSAHCTWRVVFSCSSVVLRIVGIRSAILIPVRPEVSVDDLPDPLDVHDLLHRLSAGIYGDQVVARLDEVSGPTTAESSSSSSPSSLPPPAPPAAPPVGPSAGQFTSPGAPPPPCPLRPPPANRRAIEPARGKPATPQYLPARASRSCCPYGGERRRVAASRGCAAGAGGRVDTSSRT